MERILYISYFRRVFPDAPPVEKLNKEKARRIYHREMSNGNTRSNSLPKKQNKKNTAVLLYYKTPDKSTSPSSSSERPQSAVASSNRRRSSSTNVRTRPQTAVVYKTTKPTDFLSPKPKNEYRMRKLKGLDCAFDSSIGSIDWKQSSLYEMKYDKVYNDDNKYLHPDIQVLYYLNSKYDNMKDCFHRACKILNKIWNDLYLPIDYRDKYFNTYMNTLLFDNYCEILQEINFMKDCRQLILDTLFMYKKTKKSKQEKDKEDDEKESDFEDNDDFENEKDDDQTLLDSNHNLSKSRDFMEKIQAIKSNLPWLKSFIIDGNNYYDYL